MTPIALLAAAGAGSIALVLVLRSRAATAFVLALTVGTNASAVLARHGLPPYLLPLALLTIAAGMLRVVAAPRPLRPPRTALPAAAVTVLAGVVLAAAIGPFVATDAATSARAVTLLMEHGLVVVAMAVVARWPSGTRAALLGLVTAGAALSAITNLQTLLGARSHDLGGFAAWNREVLGGTGDSLRAAGPFEDDPNAYALYLVVMLGVGVGLVLTRPPHAARSTMVVLWAAVGSMVLAVAQTASRGGFIALAAVAVAAIVVARPPVRRVVPIAAAAVALVVGPFGIGDRLASLDAAPSAGVGSTGVDSGLRGRTSEMLAAVDMFVDHPITGVGYGTYNDRYLDYSRGIGLDPRFERRSAHSLPLEIAAEQGFVGLAAWAGLAALALVVVRRLARLRRDLALPLGLALAGFGSAAIFLHDVHPRLMWSLVGLTVAAAMIVDRGHARDRLAPVLAPGEDGPIRVAMVIQAYVPAIGGAERQLASVAPLLVERGVHPLVVTRSMPGRLRHDEVDGIPVERIPVRGPKLVRSVMFVVGARAVLRRFDPHVVHAFDTMTPTTVALGHRSRTGAPVVTKILRSGELGDLHRLARKPFGALRRRRLLREADAFVAISQDIDTELAMLDVPAPRRARIPNGVDTERFRPPPTKVRTSGPMTVIATGRLAPEKRLVELAERWDVVTRRRPGTRLVVAGEGPEAERLRRFDHVDLLGPRDDVDELLRGADVYVSASRAEGLSNSLLEALATGLPSVVTDVGGVRDLIHTPQQGVIVPADDLDALVEGIAELLDDHARRRALRRLGRQRVRRYLGLDRIADELAALYRRLAIDPDVGAAVPRREAVPA